MAEIPEKAGANVVETENQSIVPNSPYSGIRREISEEDLSSPPVQRILLGEVDKLQNKVEKLELIELQFYAIDKKAAILEEKLKAVKLHEFLYSICLAIGSAVIGLSSVIWDSGYGWIAIVIGAILVVTGIVSRGIKWH